ncbi:TetR/AcrR family transcriptional regulator [Undibacterium jejuense]|uniref:TetR/AcrR family transcriptional regulator n=1 Tax=Undibacterium jejuense TaxID=1344949 RepID=A0A923KIE7_9BURK|nr:TetR/AcrR family transcriptional regulator [Undibacterium jejuense]MBC3862542.1 TetR/AcrR family transcriptional regulator [Undibacterium jejuense]
MSRNEQKFQTRQRILEGAGRGFRKGGFAGVGVDGLAKEAGVTSGAFYVHFDSKAHAFREVVVHGMTYLKNGLLQFQQEHGKQWWNLFVNFYLNERRVCDLSESCVLPSLTSEVVRSDALSRTAFEIELREVAKLIVNGPASPDLPNDVEAALAALACLIGGVSLARAVSDPDLAQTIATSVARSLLPNHSA